MSVNISLDEKQLAAIFAAGVLHPSELKCLDSASRDIVKKLCLRMCQPKSCHACENHHLCGVSAGTSKPLSRVEVALPR
ncbi:hypothetical protein [Thiomicrorhabdus cannonii]|uniref:hypothetical protein n=1 Tax=Thiomicrorhabdus cannonii TaxID=2748011 RepID=UPI0015BFA49C|nr:hypothetical protein [Thiomicrorhabdus cannonii]